MLCPDYVLPRPVMPLARSNTDCQVFLANLGISHWGNRVEMVGVEAHDTQRSVQVFGEAYLTKMLCICRTANTPVAPCLSSCKYSELAYFNAEVTRPNAATGFCRLLVKPLSPSLSPALSLSLSLSLTLSLSLSLSLLLPMHPAHWRSLLASPGMTRASATLSPMSPSATATADSSPPVPDPAATQQSGIF